MRLHFHGACRTVTGSCFLLETGRTKILIDCGMVQGSKSERELNYGPAKRFTVPSRHSPPTVALATVGRPGDLKALAYRRNGRAPRKTSQRFFDAAEEPGGREREGRYRCESE